MEVTVGSGDVTDWLAAIGAIGGAVATAVLVWLAYQQLIHLRRELRESRRPVLQLTEPTLAVHDGRLRVRVRNIGVGPAVSVEVAAKVKVLTLPDQPQIVFHGKGGPVEPHESVVVSGWAVTDDVLQLLGPVLGLVVAFEAAMTATGIDVFGMEHEYMASALRAEVFLASTVSSLTFE